MFLQNFYNLVRAAFCGYGEYSGVTLVNKAGTAFYPYVKSTAPNMAQHIFPRTYNSTIPAFVGTGTYGTPCVIFGAGTTLPTLDDYKLESPITSGLSVTATITQSSDEGTGTLHNIYSISNTSDADMTIGEIGYQGHIQYDNSHSYNVLLDRTVLAEPVAIPAGATVVIDFVLEYGLPRPPSA